MTIEPILKMIESVSPDDSKALDEIDFIIGKYLDKDPYHNGLVRYTRSRDALKAIRPEGYASWANPETNYGAVYIGQAFTGHCHSDNMAFDTDEAPQVATEELAELHAILQAIDFERNNTKDKP
jgi:hypothetical protein